MPLAKSTNPDRMIGDIEALLIRSLALKNINQMKFVAAKQWDQIKMSEIEKYRKRV
jgi:hypothetical protein